jgi:hypothetical protein
MSRRNWTVLSAVVLVFAFSQVAGAQGVQGNQAKGDPVGAANWQQDVIEELRQLRSDVQTLQSTVGGIQQSLDAVQDGFKKQMEINSALQKQVDDLSEGLKVAGGGQGLPFDAWQKDPEKAKELQNALQGKVIFENKTGEAQRIFINGAEWEVITGRSSMLVPYGQVTFHTRASNDGTLTQFNVSNWTRQGDQLVLNVPLEPTPQGDR